MHRLSPVVKGDIKGWWWVWKMDSRRSVMVWSLSEYAGSWCFQFRRSVVRKGWWWRRERPGWTEPSSFIVEDLQFLAAASDGCSQLIRWLRWAEPRPSWLGAGVLLLRWCRGHGVGSGGLLSASGPGAGGAGACGVRGTCGRGSSGSSMGSPWNIGFFLSFFLNGWVTNALLCPCLLV